jgi:two-component system sensor histidine kinase CpxA
MPASSLFVKIFLGFWVVTIAVLGSWLLAGHYLDSLSPDESQTRGDDGPPRFIMRLLYDLQNQPLEQLSQVINGVQTERKVRAYLLNAEGEDVLGRRVPANVAAVAARLDDTGRRAFLREDGRHLLAHQLFRDDLGPMRSVLVFKPSRSRLVNALGSNLWLRVVLAVLVSGLLCYVLSRVLTRRLGGLRRAAGQLAAGDLEVRLAVRTHGGDETDDLARDFNRMAALLQQRIAAQRRLLADVSHELRSPLARLRVALALAEQNPAAVAPQLSRIEREARRLDELIAELLSSQSEDSAMDEHIDLVSLLRDLCNDASFEGRESGRSIQLQCASAQALVLGNGEGLRKAFDNVLRNALYYSPPDTAVTVTVSTDAESILISVQDQGPGIPPAELTRIFDEFYRVDSARARDTGGYGLGLAIAQRAILQHGGSITARNTSPGLRMDITLPLFDNL